jgi:hypothetical protein
VPPSAAGRRRASTSTPCRKENTLSDLNELKDRARIIALAELRGEADEGMSNLITALKETIREDALKFEPSYTDADGPPVVTWERTYPNSGTYSYVAIGIQQPQGDLLWYVSNDTKPRSWEALVKFMGLSGLATQEILRGGWGDE